MTVIIANPGSAAGLTLQEAYDNDTTAPQLVPTLGDNFEINGQVVIDGALDRGEAASMQLTDTASVGAFVGGGIQSLGTITYTASTFIWALLQESKGYIANAGPAFAAFTLFNAIPFIRNGTNNALVQALCLNVGISHQSTGANAVTTVQTVGVSFSPNTRALSAGGSTTKTVGDTAVSVGPTFGTVGGSSISFGTITGLKMRNPAVALFQPSAGIESMTAYYGVDVDAIPFGGNVTKRGFRSNLAAATNTRAIECAGTAESDFNGSINLTGDLLAVRFGADPNRDWQHGWAAGGFFFEQQISGAGGQLRKSFPAVGRMLYDWAVDTELNINCALGFSLGAQTGANGNQFGNFVTDARTIAVAGEWADFLLTQGGSLTVDGNSMSRVSAWVINGVSYANSTGTVTNADTLTVGGFPTSSPGVTITNRHSLNVIGGRSRHASVMQFPPISPTALGSGDTDDWNGLLSGSVNNNMRHWARVTGNADNTSTITGIDSSETQTGDTYKLTNVGAGTITLNNEDAGSLAANRIITPNGQNYSLTENKTIEIAYDTADSRWRILTPAPQASGALSGTWQYDDTTTQADPGDGNFRTDNNTVGSVTEIYIADETKPGVDAGNILSALASGDQLYLQNAEDASEFLIFNITANNDQTGWHELQGTVNASGNNFTDGKEFIITAIFA